MNPDFTQVSIKQLGQVRPNSTDPTLLIEALDRSKFIVYTIIVTNVSGSGRTYRIFHDDDGTTYNQNSALVYDKTLASNDYEVINIRDGLTIGPKGNLAVRSNAADGITFTAYGIEVAGQGTA